MRKFNSIYKTEFLSEEGSRIINRDYFAYVELDDLACYVLADGLDDDNNLNSAQIAVTTILRGFTEAPSFSKRAIKRYILDAHNALQEVKEGMRLKVSISIVVTNYVKARYCVVGNTRFYLMRNDRILVKSADQSLTANLIAENNLEQDKAAQHEERNNLYSYLGMFGKPKFTISKKYKLNDGDAWLLFTRGMWEYCDDGELMDATTGAAEPQEIIDNVEELILSKQPERLDNYTLVVTFVEKIFKKPEKKWTAKKIFLLSLPFLIAAIILTVVLVLRHQKKVRQTNEMMSYIESAEKYSLYDNYTKASEDYAEALTLAKSLKKKEETSEIDQLKKLMDQIILGDQFLKDGDYTKAEEAYHTAQTMSFENGNVGKSYIESQLHKNEGYKDVYDLLDQGDALAEIEDDEGARAKYIEAKDLAGQIFFQDGKKEAVSKITEIDTKIAEAKKEAKAAAEAKQKEEEEKQKEEEEKQKAEEAAAKAEAEKKAEEEKAAAEKKAAEEEAAAEKRAEEEEARQAERDEEAAAAEEERKAKEESRLSALDMEKKANTYSSDGDYINALLYYHMAKDLYEELGLTNRVTCVEEKIQLTEKSIQKVNSKEANADNYKEMANELIEQERYTEALLMYNLAKDIYEEIGLTEQLEAAEEKIETLNKLVAP